MRCDLENDMANAFREIEACAPEKDKHGNFDEAAQLVKVKEEYKEALAAYEKWLIKGDKKAEEEYLEEVADTMTALATLLWAHMSKDEAPSYHIAQLFTMVNLKNELRGYQDFEEEGEKK